MIQKNDISWTVIKNEIDSHGTYTQQIQWNPPKRSSFIVQEIAVDDPCELISGYDGVYFEAWRVENGRVLHEGAGSDNYDDSFTNCWDGEWPATHIAIEKAEKQMKAFEVRRTYIAYNCIFYWMDDDSATAETIMNWKPGCKNGIIMAGELRASHTKPDGLDIGKRRTFRTEFSIDE